MARNRISARKRRTRAHVIADLSLHYLAYRVVGCGFTIEIVRSDYGYDVSIFTFDKNGEIENLNMYVQLKATDKIKISKDNKRVLFSLSKRDIRSWQDEPVPVYLVVFDAKKKRAYWLYLQRYLKSKNLRANQIVGQSITVEISTKQALRKKTIKAWRRDKAAVLKKIGAVDHG
jgi:hypothetical protein